MTKVSFVIPVFQEEKRLFECLESIVKQEDVEKEVVVCASVKLSEADKNRIEDYAKRCDLKLNMFLGASLGELYNKGLAISQGEYVSFLDPNNVLKENSLREINFEFNATSCDLCISKVIHYNEKSNEYKESNFEYGEGTEVLENENIAKLNKNDISLMGKYFKKVFLTSNGIGFSDTQYYSEWLFMTGVYLNCNKVLISSISTHVNRMRIGLEKVNNPELEKRIDFRQLDDVEIVYWDVLNYCEGVNGTILKEKVVQGYVQFMLKRGIKYINISKEQEGLYLKIKDKILSKVENVDFNSSDLNENQKELLKVISTCSFEEYVDWLKRERLYKDKQKNYKIYIKGRIFCALYTLASKLPVKKNSVLFISHSKGMNGNYPYIQRSIDKYNEDKSKDERINTGYVSTKSGMIGKLVLPIKVALAESIILSENVPFFRHIDVRNETTVIQSWHAAGAFKKFGYSTSYLSAGPNPFENRKMDMHNYYDYATVSSEEVKGCYADAFRMSEDNIIATGLPRTDFFADEQMVSQAKDKIYSIYPRLKDKKVILYAPTFRGSGKRRKEFTMEFDFNAIARGISDEYIIALKLHPSVSSSEMIIDEDVKHKVIDISSYADANEVLILTDILITDYSSIIFDYSLLSRPMIFYAYDLEDYRFDRDFYYKYEEFIPGPLVVTNDEIIKVINEDKFDLTKVDEFCDKFFVSKDGKNSERFLHQVILKETRGI